MHGLPAMGELKLYGTKAAFAGIITTAVKQSARAPADRPRSAHRRDQRQARRSIGYRITTAELPLPKDIDDFVIDDAPSTRPWFVILPPASSFPISAMSCWSAEPARPILP
jgi:hypothetical protein